MNDVEEYLSAVGFNYFSTILFTFIHLVRSIVIYLSISSFILGGDKNKWARIEWRVKRGKFKFIEKSKH